ncbi:MAG: MFS transporter [Chloroflexi bacterium]|jgi:MFS transporter, DHA1 family, tetracycline resistance protein|nr:MFS transporter [Chloroflexota bacterium]
METHTKNAATASPEEKLDFKKILPVFVIVLIDLLGLTIIIPLLPLYAASYGANAFVIGALGAAYPVMQFLGAPLLGRLSDRFGRRPVLIVSQIGTLIGFIVLGIANTLWLLFISRIIDGISGANIATAQAVITDNTTEKTRTQGLGLIGAAFGLGFIVGPIIAFLTLAFSDNNYHLVAYVAAGFSLISILLTYFWLEESYPPEKRGQKDAKTGVGLKAMLNALKKPQIGLLLALMFFQQFAFGGFEQLLSLFTLNRLGMNASSNAGLFVYVGIIVVAVQGYFVGKWSRKFGDRWLVRMGLLALGIGLLFAALTPARPVPWYSRADVTAELSGEVAHPGETPPVEDIQIDLPDDTNTGWIGLVWLGAAMIPAAIGGGILQPSINSMITQHVAPNEIGGTLGISAAFLSGANAITPLVMGAFFEWMGSSAPFLIGSAILLVLWMIAQRTIVKE